MLTFKTQFPIEATRTTGDLLACAHRWITGSPHSKLANVLPPSLSDGGSYSSGGETLLCMVHEDELHQCAGVRYEMLDPDNIRWTTDFVGCRERDGQRFMVAAQLGVDSELPVEHLEQGRRPYVIKNAMQRLGGGEDGALRVSDTPIVIADDDIDLAADLICGKAGLQMPVVYVSADNGDAPHIDTTQLAKWLSGMAHVVVEPSRSFSFKLMRSVYGENAYGGAVAIYWPDGIGKWLFLPVGRLNDPKEMQIAISRKVRSSLLSQRTVRECTWSYLRDVRARRRIEELKASGSQNVDEYIKHFDTELTAKETEIERLEAEVSRLTYSRQFGSATERTAIHDLAMSTHERDLYQGERLDIVLDALRVAQQAAEAHSRRADILSDILSNNASAGERDVITGQLKEILRQYSNMDAKSKKSLEDLGFEISEDGKHYKLTYQGESRYPFILPKTGSDWRGGLNAFSDLKRRLF